MKTILYFLLFSTYLNVTAQTFSFPVKNYKSFETLDSALPALAIQVMSVYKEENKTTYFDNMLFYALAAHKYKEALRYIDSERYEESAGNYLNAVTLRFNPELYAKTQLYRQIHHTSFSEAYKQVFNIKSQQLTPVAKVENLSSSVPSVAALKNNMESLINRLKNSDTLSLDDAKEMLLSYSRYQVYMHVLPVLRVLITKTDKEEFVVLHTRIKTRDSSIIPVLIVRKKNEIRQLPVVFIFNIYIDSSSDITDAKRYAAAGFVGVVANTRGKGISPQTIEPYEHDANDAYDIIDWISHQTWCNGKVGMTGGSYLGFTQWAAAKTLHPALKTIIPAVSVNPGNDFPMLGNVFKSYMLRWIHFVTNSKETDFADFFNTDYWNNVYRRWYEKGTTFHSLDTVEGRSNKIFQRWLQHPALDAYWQNTTSYGKDFSKLTIPVLTLTGYFDDDQTGALDYYREYESSNSTAKNYLVIGPYDHNGAGSYPARRINNYRIDSAAIALNFYELSIQWFNYILKDSIKPSLLTDKVNFEVMNTNKWKHVSSLSKMSNDTITYYFKNTMNNQYYNLSNNADTNAYVTQEVNFKDRSDSTLLGDYIYPHDTALNNDAITFISQLLENSLMMSGASKGQLNVAINKKDMDLLIQVYELLPNGTYFKLSSSLQRASFAKDRTRRQLLQPDQKQTIPILYSFATSKLLNKGSRVLITVGVNKNPNWQINYGTGKDVSDETIADAEEPLRIKWFCDSFIQIPVIK